MKDQLVKEIEAQLNWGDSIQWSNKDFQELRERIFEQTHKHLSVTTLKRIWGRAEMIAQPSTATLDILAEFAGYRSWRQFRQSHVANLTDSPSQPPTQESRRKRRVFGLIVLVLLSGSIWLAMGSRHRPAEVSVDSVEFSFQKVTTGYPNTVIFQYDVKDASYDSLSIQQSWDSSKRILLTEPQGLVTTTYYYPGYFLTKLMVNDQVLLEKDLYIPTQGWQGIVWEGKGAFTYLNPVQLQQDSTLSVTPDVLQLMNQPRNAVLMLSNLSDQPRIDSRDFRLETEFRLAQPTKRSICQNVRLTVTGTKEVLGLQFSKPGCVGDLMLALNQEMISGRNEDLSGFGQDLTRWVHCLLEVKDNQLRVALNQQEVFQHQLSSDIGLIGGVQWGFEGLGEIRLLRLYDQQSRLDLMAPEHKK